MKKYSIELSTQALEIITSSLWDRLETLRCNGEPPTDEKIEQLAEVSDVSHNIFLQVFQQQDGGKLV